MKQIFIINDVATDIRIMKDFTLLGAGVIDLTGLDKMQPVCFKGLGDITSVDLEKGELVKLTKIAASAGRQQTATVNLTGAETPLYVKVIMTTLGTANVPMKTLEGPTAASIRDLINDLGTQEGDYKGITATLSGSTLTIKSEIKQDGTTQTFRVAASKGAVISYYQTALPVSGTPEHVAILEADHLPYEGITNKVKFPVIKPDSNVKSDTTYDLIVADFYPEADAKDGSGRKTEKIKLVFAYSTDIVTAGKTSDDFLASLANFK